MSLPPYPRNIVALGRAFLRFIEAAEHIAESCEVDEERKQLRRMIRRYKKGLRAIVDTQPAYVVAEIMSASDRVLGPAQELGQN